MKFDYLIVGAGASGMAFLDVILAETEATVAIVDRRDAPGGHWNDAYPFVRLHQSSWFYGVPSRELGQNRVTDRGYNKGLFELATKPEILHYYQDLMETVYLPTGRVTYFPMSVHEGDGVITSLVSGQTTKIEMGKTVEAGVLGDQSSIPATHKRNFDVAPDVTCVPVNDLPRRAPDFEDFTVLGAGKTAMDAVLWLLAHDVDPAHITWVRPSDYWIIQRDKVLAHKDFFFETMTGVVEELRSLGGAKTVDEHVARMEEVGNWVRIDPDHWPEKFHAATCSAAEMAALKTIRNVVRKGRVTALEAGRMVLEKGAVPVTRPPLYVDCTASAAVILDDPDARVFDGDRINIFMVRPFQPVFSAALIAHVEAVIDDEEIKQRATGITDFFDTPAQSLVGQRQGFLNQYFWNQTPQIKDWVDTCRLNAGTHILSGLTPADADKMQLLGQVGPLTAAAVENIPRILAEDRH